MSSFIHVEQPSQHPGVERFSRVAESAQTAVKNFDASRSGATLLLAAVVSALLVVANQVVDTWTEGRLLAAWIVLWTLGFAALALFAAPARRAAAALRDGLTAWNAQRRQAREDQQLWSLALTDARVMADLSRAMTRDAARDVRGYY
jgi:hypothetical protein